MDHYGKKARTAIIVLNALQYNRGSEALVRGFVSLLKSHDSEMRIVVAAGHKIYSMISIQGVDKFIPRYCKGRIRNRLSKIFSIAFDQCFATRVFHCRALLKQARKSDVIYIVGADNYDYHYHLAAQMYQINSMLLKYTSHPIHLVDCSFNKMDLTKEVINDIRRFDTVVVRESISYNTIKQLIQKPVIRCPDPAFALDPQECILPQGLVKRRTIGINISNLMLNMSNNRSFVMKSFLSLIENILKNTKCNILLVPHVMNNADLNALKELYDECKKDKNINIQRVIIWDNHMLNAGQIKFVISQLEFLITARTHASIAAYSTYVPTLVIGYSIKSVGIATDLFGTDNGYVVDIRNIVDDDLLYSAFSELWKRREEIHEHLKKIMPEYVRTLSAYFDIMRLNNDGK